MTIKEQLEQCGRTVVAQGELKIEELFELIKKLQAARAKFDEDVRKARNN